MDSLRKLISPHYHGELKKFLDGEKPSERFLKVLKRTPRLIKAIKQSPYRRLINE